MSSKTKTFWKGNLFGINKVDRGRKWLDGFEHNNNNDLKTGEVGLKR